MSDQPSTNQDGRREFLRKALAGTVGATTTAIAPPAFAQLPAAAPAASAAAPPPPATYSFLNLEEQAFVEALVNHMVPADQFTPKGTDIGINVFIDRALSGAWGKGDRLYMQGPWRVGEASQGYQLPLTPAQLYRAGIEATNAYCVTTYKKKFDKIDATQREQVLLGLSSGKLDLGALPSRIFFATIYQTVMEGLFSDPIYGGNRDKAGWKMIGFPGALAVNRENVEKYRDKPFPTNPIGIADMS